MYDTGNGIKESMIFEHYMRTSNIIGMIAQSDDEAMSEMGLTKKMVSMNNYYFKPNKTINLDAQFVRRANAEFGVCPSTYKAPQKRSINKLSLYFTENAAGKILVDVVEKSLVGTLNKKFCELNDQLTETIGLLNKK